MAPRISPLPLFSLALALRIVLLLYGLWQDAHSALKYTDIDYLVFTDAARAVATGRSPYDRETYRYTPLLAWLLAPGTALATYLASASASASASIFASAPLALLAASLGKVLFAIADLGAGWLLLRLLRRRGHDADGEAGRFAALWLWNPMVAIISTRGSSEGVLGLLVAGLLCAVLERRVGLAGVLLGLGVHLKIYPFIYAPAIVWWMDAERLGQSPTGPIHASWTGALAGFVTRQRLKLIVVSLGVLAALNSTMYWIYGMPFVDHTYLYHITRQDHRHNFSPYNMLLYLSSASPHSGLRVESFAFLPQLLISTILIPFVLAKKDLATAMLAQTFAFVTFNKVCTSQYFLWYMVLLPLYLPNSSFLKNARLGVTALGLWVAAQAAWLQQAYQLEFGGASTFMPGMWLASLAFFLVNCWILGIIIRDGGTSRPDKKAAAGMKQARPRGRLED